MEAAGGNSAMESGSTPENVLKQVEALFSVIESLPESVREAALKKIQLKLNVAEPTDSTNRVEHLEKTFEDESSMASGAKEEHLEPKIATKLKRKPVRRSTIYRGAEKGGEKMAANSIPEEGAVMESTSKSKRIVRRPQRYMNGTSDSEDEGNDLTKGSTASGDREGVTVDSRLKSKGVRLSPDDPHPVFVYRVPKDVNTKDFVQPIEESARDEEPKRKKGLKTVYGCTVCDRKFHSKSLVFIHMRRHTGEKPHKCDVCQKSFSQLGGLSMHKKRHEGVFNFNCQYCEYKSLLKVDMLRHEARHRKEKNYFCEICGKSFATDPALRHHIQHVHQRSNRFVCQICGFVTHQAGNLKRHIDVRHSNKECIACPVCGDVLKQRSSFITHMRTHTGERPHSCRDCGKAFKNQSQVAAHARTHSEGTFSCTECSRLFKTRFHLKRHSLVHTGEKPFKCEHCPYSCNVKGNINKHVKMVHGVQQHSEKVAALASASRLNRVGRFTQPEEIAGLREKGTAMAEEFLSKMSLRKDEQLTVETLRIDMATKEQAAALATAAETRVAKTKSRRRPAGYSRKSVAVARDQELEEEAEEARLAQGMEVSVDASPSGTRIEFCADEEQQQQMLEQNLQIALLTGMREEDQRGLHCAGEVIEDGDVHLTLLNGVGDGQGSTSGGEGNAVQTIFIPSGLFCVEPDGSKMTRHILTSSEEEGTVFIIRCDDQE